MIENILTFKLPRISILCFGQNLYVLLSWVFCDLYTILTFFLLLGWLFDIGYVKFCWCKTSTFDFIFTYDYTCQSFFLFCYSVVIHCFDIMSSSSFFDPVASFFCYHNLLKKFAVHDYKNHNYYQFCNSSDIIINYWFCLISIWLSSVLWGQTITSNYSSLIAQWNNKLSGLMGFGFQTLMLTT